MRLRLFLLAAAAGLLLAWPAQAQTPRTAAPPTPPAVVTETTPRAPAPAVKAGQLVRDRGGAEVGRVETLVESEVGVLVVVRIDGKAVGVPAAVLTLRGDEAISSLTKAEMVALAGAPG